MEGGPECRGTYGRWARLQGNLWKVCPKAGELMEGGPKCRGTYGMLVCRVGDFETKKCPKNGIFYVFFFLFDFSIFLLNNLKNSFDIKDAHISGGRFDTKIG